MPTSDSPKNQSTELGDRLGRFILRKHLGGSDAGQVYAAFDTQRGRHLALKTVPQCDLAALAELKKQFRSLAEIAHPGLVQLYEMLPAESGDWFYTMELVRGVDVLSYIRGGAPESDADDRSMAGPTGVISLPLTSGQQFARLRSTLTQVAEGIGALHDVGKLHRDIKPSNILVTRSGRSVLLDFGLVTHGHNRRIDVSAAAAIEPVVGTPEYMAPEQAAGHAVSNASDWYAFGVVLYEALTGRLPFTGSADEIKRQKLDSEPPAPRTISPRVPDDLDALCIALLANDPNERPQRDEVLFCLGAHAVELFTPLTASTDLASHTPVFVGRSSEFRKLRDVVEVARTRRSNTIFVRGRSGIGKSTLVQRFLDTLTVEYPDLLIFSGRTCPNEVIPFNAIDTIATSLARHLHRIDSQTLRSLLPDDSALLARMFPALRRVPAIAARGLTSISLPNKVHLRTLAFRALGQLLGRIARQIPVVLFIDDLQWADADSVALLSDLMHNEDARLAVIATIDEDAESGDDADEEILYEDARDSGSGPTQPWLSFRDTLRRYEEIELSALEPVESKELARMLLKRITTAGPGESIVKIVHERAHGHPMLIDALIRHIGDATISLDEPETLSEALESRIQRLDEDPRRMLELVATAGVPPSLEVLSLAADLDVGTCNRYVSHLRVANLARAQGGRSTDIVECMHEQIRATVLDLIEEDKRVELHRRIAEALETTGAGGRAPHTLINHWAACGNMRRAAEHALEAGRRAHEALAFEQASVLFRRCLELGDHTVEAISELRQQIADCLRDAGHLDDAAEEYLKAASGQETSRRLRLQAQAFYQLQLSGHNEYAQELLEPLLTETGLPSAPSSKAALRNLKRQRLALSWRGIRFQECEENQVPERELTSLDVGLDVVMAHAMTDPIRAAEIQTRGLRRALKLGEPTRIARYLALEAIFRGAQGGKDVKLARAMLRTAKKISADEDIVMRGWNRAGKALLAQFIGRFRDSNQALAEAEEIFRDNKSGPSLELSMTRVLQLVNLRTLGEFAELDSKYQSIVRDAQSRGDRYTVDMATRLAGILYLVRDDVHGAADAIATLKPPSLPQSQTLQVWHHVRAHAELDIYRGDAGATRHRDRDYWQLLESSPLARLPVTYAEIQWLSGRLAIAEVRGGHDIPGRCKVVRNAIRRLRRAQTPLSPIYRLILEAGVATLEHNDSVAERALAQAAGMCEELDLGVMAALVRLQRSSLQQGEVADATRRDATEYLRSQGVIAPERFAQTFVTLGSKEE